MHSGTTIELPVTIVIPAYNRERLIARAIDSVRRQERVRPQEIIVVDDASDDGTAAEAERCGVRVLRHADNRGPGAARNTGFDAVQTRWVVQLDSDDEWLPGCLKTLWELREGHVLVSGAYVGDGAAPFFMGSFGRRPRILRSPAELFFPDNLICASAVLMRTDVLRAVGGYDGTMRYAEDLDLWVRMLEAGPAALSPSVVTRHHGHAGQATAQPGRLDEGHRQVISRYTDRPWWTPTLTRHCEVVPLWEQFRDARRRGDLGIASRALSRLFSDYRRVGALVELLVHNRRCRQALRAAQRQPDLQLTGPPARGPAPPSDA